MGTLRLQAREDVSTHIQSGKTLEEHLFYEEAIAQYKKALSFLASLGGADHPGLAALHANICHCYNQLGEYRQAIGYGKLGQEIFEKNLGSDPDFFIGGYLTLGLIYKQLGYYQEAKKALFAAQELLEAGPTLGEEDIVSLYETLGEVYREQGQYEEALHCFRRVKNLAEELDGKVNRPLAFAYVDLALTYTRQGRYEQALDHYGEALKITKKLERGQTDQPLTQILYRSMAISCKVLGRKEEADQYSKKVKAVV